ncbi:hypothetical protein [Methylomonas koyamae]|uniref:Alpha/beta hydrolase n=1 Tax=Methylomonas koyamae TaxID=702114 RepID=A0AA91DA72_9GAMM|nr:hypothetical protein [Methylomonas koyamae]OAI22350.1 hypothetical protein A1356_19230 [Methylomonas koyamae]
MRLVFVHGINNENNTIDSIAKDWWGALSGAWTKMGLASKSKPTINVAYYGKMLAEATNGESAVEMGPSEISTGYAMQLLSEYAEAAGVTQDDLNTAADKRGIPRNAVEQGVPHEGWVIAFADLLEDILPDKGKFIAKLFLRQAATYINDKALAAKIDKTVQTQIFDGLQDPAIIIAHSLGTVVTYRLLTKDQQIARNIPLYVTLGSPLSVKMFKPILPAKGSFPHPPITKWINGRHEEDFVTLGRSITKQSIGFDGVIDETDILNDDDDKHSIIHYLSSPDIAQAIYDVL